MPTPVVTPQIEINPTHIEHPALEFLRSYWEARRADRAMPSRSDMRPADFKPYLGNIAMVDVLDGGAEFRYRIVGTLLTQYFLTDPTGKTFTETWPDPPGPVAQCVRANLVNIVETHVMVHAWGRLDWSHYPGETFDTLYVPLSDDGRTVNVILNLFTFDRSRALLDRELARQRGETGL